MRLASRSLIRALVACREDFVFRQLYDHVVGITDNFRAEKNQVFQ